MATFIDTQACIVIVTAHTHNHSHLYSPSMAPAAALSESMLLAGRSTPLLDFSSRNMNVHSTKTLHTLSRARFPHHPRPTPVLSPQGKFTFCLMARATQIEDRSPFPDLQRPLSPADNGDPIRSGVWVVSAKGEIPKRRPYLCSAISMIVW